MVKQLHTARKVIFYLVEWLELIISVLALAGIAAHLIGVPSFWAIFHVDGLSDYLKYLFDALIGIELIKLLIKLIIKGTSTGFVGELANFIIGAAMVIPAGVIYRRKKTKKSAIIGMAISTVTMSVVGVFLNAYVMIPLYSAFMPIEQIVEAGKAIIPWVSNTFTFCLFCVLPFNLIKGVIVSVIVAIIYKPLSRLIHKGIE